MELGEYGLFGPGHAPQFADHFGHEVDIAQPRGMARAGQHDRCGHLELCKWVLRQLVLWKWVVCKWVLWS